jgi:hypothetical protein
MLTPKKVWTVQSTLFLFLNQEFWTELIGLNQLVQKLLKGTNRQTEIK